MKYRFFCVLGGIILLTACGSRGSNKKCNKDTVLQNDYDANISHEKDSQESFVETAKTYHLISIDDVTKASDTLILWTMDEFINTPLGKYKTSSDIRKAFGNNVTTVLKCNVFPLDSVYYKNHLIVFAKFSVYEDKYYDYSEYFSIKYLKITDSSLKLTNGISLKMSKKELLSKFNYKPSESDLKKYNVVKLSRSLAGPEQNYYFNLENILDSIVILDKYRYNTCE